jgi:hypothetical protein
MQIAVWKGCCTENIGGCGGEVLREKGIGHLEVDRWPLPVSILEATSVELYHSAVHSNSVRVSLGCSQYTY